MNAINLKNDGRKIRNLSSYATEMPMDQLIQRVNQLQPIILRNHFAALMKDSLEIKPKQQLQECPRQSEPQSLCKSTQRQDPLDLASPATIQSFGTVTSLRKSYFHQSVQVNWPEMPLQESLEKVFTQLSQSLIAEKLKNVVTSSSGNEGNNVTPASLGLGKK